MNAHVLLWTSLAAVLGGTACGPSESSASGQSPSRREATVENIDPCTLVTKDEIQTAIEAKRNPSELARLKSRGIVWSISTTSVTEGEARRCQIHWQGNFGSVMQEKGDMAVEVYKAEYFKAQVSDMNRVRRRNGRPELTLIPGVRDEAYYFGYSEKGNPEARVGNVAVGVESLAGKPSLDLLRAAVSRVH
ncbi:MAG TPA: hypothetical protein VGQ56_02610 [Gemmatimonadaceae bacterium]|jgi:hypothetical protein|nr:hypothetical protein [Gemmatimonadaceae bacterium]